MKGKKRNVYFLEATLTQGDGSTSEIEEGFWQHLHKHVAEAPTAQRFQTIGGRRYGGAARTEHSPAVDYLYLGKRRLRSDFPDHAPDDGDEEVALDVPGHLVEPMYAVPVGESSTAAFMRTSGGPTFEAFEKWVSAVLQLEETGTLFNLRPCVREDALERLRGADGVAMLDVKFEPDALTDDDSGSRITTALRDVERVGGGGVSIEARVSYGNARPSDLGSEAYARELEQILQRPGIGRAKATLLNRKGPTVNGRPAGFDRDSVNFLRDQIVHSVAVGESEEDGRTPSIVLSAMSEAIREYRRGLE